MDKVLGAAKAIVGALVAGLTSMQLAVTASSDQGSTISQGEWINIAIATLGALGLVYAVKNKGQKNTPPQG